MTYHEWEDWVDPRYPVTGPAISWANIDTWVFHYTAAVNLPDGDFGESHNDLPGYMRRVHQEYLHRTPPYSIGYNEAFDWLGGVWKARGHGIRCAANLNHNDHTYAALMLVDSADPATDLCVQAVRERYAEACKRAGKARGKRWYQLKQVGHQGLAPTGCPGLGIMAQLMAGRFMVTEDEAFPPKPEPKPPQETDMQPSLFHVNGSLAKFLGSATPGGHATDLTWMGPGGADGRIENAIAAHLRAGAKEFHVNQEDLVAVILHGEVPFGDVVPWSETNFAKVV